MTKGRLEAFSDGVIAIIITIMVLELKVPHGTELRGAAAARAGVPELRAELRVRGHLLEQPPPPAARRPPRGRPDPVGQPAPAVLALAVSVRDALDGRDQLRRLAGGGLRGRAADGGARVHRARPRSAGPPRLGLGPGTAIGSDFKGNVSLACYVLGILLSVLVSRWLGLALYTAVALIWLVPDLRIERALAERRNSRDEPDCSPDFADRRRCRLCST